MSQAENLTLPVTVQKELETYDLMKPFIARSLTINHDINNSLAGIIGYCEFLIEEQDSMTGDQQEYVRQILKCTEKIQKIVEDLCVEKTAVSEKMDVRAFIENHARPVSDHKS